MRFLANENFPLPSILLIREAAHRVVSVSESFSGISDNEVIKKAQTEKLIILTFDKDYGELIFRHAHENPPAVVFFRFKGSYPETAGHLLVELMKRAELNLEGRFTVIEEDGIRQRSYNL